MRGRFFWIRYWEGLATWPRRFCNLVGDLSNPQQEDDVVYARPLHGAWEFIPYPSDLGWLFVHCNRNHVDRILPKYVEVRREHQASPDSSLVETLSGRS